MNQPNWEKSKETLRKFVEKGLHDIKELAAETSFMTDQTTSILKLGQGIIRNRMFLSRQNVANGRLSF